MSTKNAREELALVRCLKMKTSFLQKKNGSTFTLLRPPMKAKTLAPDEKHCDATILLLKERVYMHT